MKKKRRLLLGIAVICISALIAASCGDDDDDATPAPATDAPTTDAPAPTEAAPAPTTDAPTTAAPTTAAPPAAASEDMRPSIEELKNTDLSGICPDPLIIQTDWFPEPEHGHTYQLVGVDGEIDTTNGYYTGPLYSTGIDVQVRAGGPYMSSASPSQQFYSDPDIFMAYVNTSDALKFYKNTPTVAVLTNFEVGPQILMWDPAVYDSFDTFKDIGDSGATVLYFAGANYMDLLLDRGDLDAANVDDSYIGAPGRFIAEGDLVQQGFATSEPYRYENDIEGWLKPVAFKLIHDSGHEIYQSAVSVKPETLTDPDLRACLEAVVPIMQADIVDYMNDPDALNVRLDEIVKALDSFWTSSIPAHNWATQQMKDLGLVTDGDNNMVGDMDEARIQRFIDLMSPIHTKNGVEGFEEGADIPSASDLFTNEFLYPDISLGY